MKRRILLADDSVTIQKVIELTFMDEDYEVRAVSNGDEAVALLAEMHPEFVIADVHMPGANGYEVCRRAKAQRADLPVLLLVGTFEPLTAGASSAFVESGLFHSVRLKMLKNSARTSSDMCSRMRNSRPRLALSVGRRA